MKQKQVRQRQNAAKEAIEAYLERADASATFGETPRED